MCQCFIMLGSLKKSRIIQNYVSGMTYLCFHDMKHEILSTLTVTDVTILVAPGSSLHVWIYGLQKKSFTVQCLARGVTVPTHVQFIFFFAHAGTQLKQRVWNENENLWSLKFGRSLA